MEPLLAYLRSMAVEKREASRFEPESLPFITLSRQCGAGGHTLAEAILAAMRERGGPLFSGWQVFDEEICVRILGDPKLRVSLRSLVAEEYNSEIENFFLQLLAGVSPQSVIHSKTFETVRSLALAGKAILIGRGAACYTRDIPNGAHLRLVAPEEDRLRAMEKRLGCSAGEARKTIAERDSARAKLVKTYFRRDIDDPTLYDAVWNSGSVPIPTIAALVVEWIRSTPSSAKADASAGRRPAPASRPSR